MESDAMLDGIRTVPDNEKAVDCLECGSSIQSFPSVDHHPRVCPACGAEIFVISTMDRNILIDMKKVSDEVKRFIRWAQTDLSEFEFVQLVLTLGQVLCSDAKAHQR